MGLSVVCLTQISSLIVFCFEYGLLRAHLTVRIAALRSLAFAQAPAVDHARICAALTEAIEFKHAAAAR
jgi:hypothetical protein